MFNGNSSTDICLMETADICLMGMVEWIYVYGNSSTDIRLMGIAVPLFPSNGCRQQSWKDCGLVSTCNITIKHLL